MTRVSGSATAFNHSQSTASVVTTRTPSLFSHLSHAIARWWCWSSRQVIATQKTVSARRTSRSRVRLFRRAIEVVVVLVGKVCRQVSVVYGILRQPIPERLALTSALGFFRRLWRLWFWYHINLHDQGFALGQIHRLVQHD